jgi:pyruvate dehydrogenase E2 component (dihydrolipoamide acetyltransferase)
MADLVTMPKLGFDMAEGTLVRWVKAEGESVEKGELLAEIETDKATVEVESSHTGTIRRHLVVEGDIVPVGDPIAVVADADEEIDFEALVGAESEDEQPIPADSPSPASTVEDVKPATPVLEPPSADGAHLPGDVRASPLARRMAAEEGINLKEVTGSGAGGRITKNDILAFKAQPATPTSAARPVEAPQKIVLTEPREDRRIPLSRLRGAIGRRMTESKQQLPHFYVTYDYDMAAVMALRKQLNVILEPEGVKLSVNDFILKAAALALRDYPNLNAALEGDHVVQYGHINVGAAVAVENGLLTVVCHDTDFKSLGQISVEVREKAGRVREGKVQPDDIEGSTFTTSNLGMFAVEEFIAIINPPEAAILAIGAVRVTPVIVDGEVQAGMRMKATISVDHRVSDGAEAAQFLQAMSKYLEEPLHLMV